MNKIKNLAIFTIILIYFIGMILTFSGGLIYQIQIVRHQNQIENITNTETLEFSLNEWNNFSELNEIKFKGKYYDVISFQNINSKISAKVVKDDFENEIRITFNKIFNKQKSPLSEKKKTNSFYKHILLKNEFSCSNKLNLGNFNIKIFDRIIDCKTSTYINFQEKPPC